jgi:hypothetical protein
MKRFWISWYATGETGAWTLESPWWISGARIAYDKYGEFLDHPTVVAAVLAENEEAAKEVILAAHDRRPATIEWRFCSACPAGWSPFSDRFPRADWMQWPEQVGGA